MKSLSLGRLPAPSQHWRRRRTIISPSEQEQHDDTKDPCTTSTAPTKQMNHKDEDATSHTSEDDTPQSPRRRSLYSTTTKTTASCFSNHVLVNRERVQRNLPKLHRSTELDSMARAKAQELARIGFLQPTRRHHPAVAETILRGTTVRAMHDKYMRDLPKHRGHVLSRRYNEMGMGTAHSDVDGKLYMVQYFRYNTEARDGCEDVVVEPNNDDMHYRFM